MELQSLAIAVAGSCKGSSSLLSSPPSTSLLLGSCTRFAACNRQYLILQPSRGSAKCGRVVSAGGTKVELTQLRHYSGGSSHIPRLSLQKEKRAWQQWGGGGGGGGQTMDFQCIINHVINEGHAYFCGKCHVSYKSVRFPGLIDFLLGSNQMAERE